MAKRFLLVLALAAFAVSGVFAQEAQPAKSASVKKIWVSIDWGMLGAGARVEYMLGPKISVGANAFANMMMGPTVMGANAVARYYPWGKKFFAGLGLGFDTLSASEVPKGKVKIDGEEHDVTDVTDKEKSYKLPGFGIVPELGWKIDVAKPGGFFLSPSVKVPIVIGEKDYDFGYDVHATQFGIGVGVVVNFALGWAF